MAARYAPAIKRAAGQQNIGTTTSGNS